MIKDHRSEGKEGKEQEKDKGSWRYCREKRE